MGFRRSSDITGFQRPAYRPLIQARTNRRGPWFRAQYDGECDTCGESFYENEEIRADGDGGWEARACCGDDE